MFSKGYGVDGNIRILYLGDHLIECCLAAAAGIVVVGIFTVCKEDDTRT